jgi:hypothetical protein
VNKEIATKENTEIACVEKMAMSVEDIMSQIALIQHIMKRAMKENEHYGTIPGTSKPTLLKPGAEKLCLTFRFDPNYEIIREVREKMFIAYTVKCTLVHIPSGNKIASGIGSCNSRETKYRYRSENTGKTVPKEYWENRDSEIIGGIQYKPRKKDGKWYIFEQIENDNPWDLDNTLIKMACKRALVAATLNATAASDIFTQDIEDMPSELITGGDHSQIPTDEKSGSKEKTSTTPDSYNELLKKFQSLVTKKIIKSKDYRLHMDALGTMKTNDEKIEYLKTQIFAIEEGNKKGDKNATS